MLKNLEKYGIVNAYIYMQVRMSVEGGKGHRG